MRHTWRAGSEPLPDATDGEIDEPGSDAPGDVTEALLALLVERPEPAQGERRIEGIVVGSLIELGERPLVTWPGAREPVAARAIAALHSSHVGGEVALMFELGDPARPLVMGPIQPMMAARASVDASDEPVAVEAIADGERVVLQAERELVLRCGKASITLTRAGKILIRGAYVSSHADGTQRIRGATVEIN